VLSLGCPQGSPGFGFLAYASSSFRFHSPFTHSLASTYVPASVQSSRYPATLFPLVPLLPTLPRPHTHSSRTVLPAAPALPPSRRRSPDFLRKRELVPDQSRRVFLSVLQLGPSQHFPQGGCWPTFPTRSPGDASRPRRVLSSGHSLPVGSGDVIMLPPPISKRSLQGGADVTRGARWALPPRNSSRPARVIIMHIVFLFSEKHIIFLY
jgi:hypothetical protein